MGKLNEIRNSLNDIMMNNFVIYDKEPSFLYHYTTLDSAKSIIKSGQFWASDAFKTNDESEIIHTKEIMREIIEENVNYQMYQDSIFVSFDTICELISKKSFILCFSLDKSSNKLWDDYAKTGGVCLRFKFETLTPNVFKEFEGQERFFENKKGNIAKMITLNLNHKVSYDKGFIKNKIKEYLELAYLCLKLIPLSAIENDANINDTHNDEFNLLNEIFTDIFLFSCISKESKWRDEIEYRMLFLFPDENKLDEIIHQRTSFDKKQIIDYLKLNLKRNNTFSLNRIFVKEKKYIKVAKKELKSFIDNEIKIKYI